MQAQNPYRVTSNLNPQISSAGKKWRHGPIRSAAFVWLITPIFGISKWWFPPLLGTGSAFTLGTWIEEWFVVLLFGVSLGYIVGWSSVWGAVAYYCSAYLLFLPVFINDKFCVLVLAFGLFSSSLLAIGSIVGSFVSLRIVHNKKQMWKWETLNFSHQNDSSELSNPEMGKLIDEADNRWKEP